MKKVLLITTLALVLVMVPATVILASTTLIWSENFDVGTTPGQSVMDAPLSWLVSRDVNEMGWGDGNCFIAPDLHPGWTGQAIDGSSSTGGSVHGDGVVYLWKQLPSYSQRIIRVRAKVWANSLLSNNSGIGFARENDAEGERYLTKWTTLSAELGGSPYGMTWVYQSRGGGDYYPFSWSAPWYRLVDTTLEVASYVDLDSMKSWGTITDGTLYYESPKTTVSDRPYYVYIHQSVKGGSGAWNEGVDVDDIVVEGLTAVPDKLTYQGKLTNPAGSPVADGNYTFVMRIYDSETGGRLIWTSADTSIATSGGLFTAVITGVPEGAFPSVTDLWMEAVVNGETLSPRLPVTSDPFSLRSGKSGA